MRTLGASDFKSMPWKNGGGETLELICIKNSQSEEILFRLSSATVSQSGPFSFFPQLNRQLFLVKGDGLKLNFPDKVLILDKINSPIQFMGEEKVDCQLLGSTCIDFNVMINRNYGESELKITHFNNGVSFKCQGQMSYLYFPQIGKLVELSENETYHHQDENLEVYIINLFLRFKL